MKRPTLQMTMKTSEVWVRAFITTFYYVCSPDHYKSIT
jgi:hypothetical protein